MRIPSHLSLFVTVAYVLRRRWSSPGFERLDIEAAAPASSLPPFFPFLFPPPLPAAPFFTGFFPAKRKKPRDRQCCSPDRFDRTRREKRNRGKKEEEKKETKGKERKKKNVARNLRVSPIFNSSFPSPTDSSTRIICARIFPTFEKKKEKKEKTNYLGERERERRLASSREFVEVSRNGEIEGRR